MESVARVTGHDGQDYSLSVDGDDEGGFEAVMAGTAARLPTI